MSLRSAAIKCKLGQVCRKGGVDEQFLLLLLLPYHVLHFAFQCYCVFPLCGMPVSTYCAAHQGPSVSRGVLSLALLSWPYFFFTLLVLDFGSPLRLSRITQGLLLALTSLGQTADSVNIC